MSEEKLRAEPPYRLRRNKVQGSYSKERIFALLDSAAICHLAVIDEGLPVVIPTLYARMEEVILVHGSRGSSVLKAAQAQEKVNLVVTLVDALVLPDNIFDHTVDYRSVSVAGRARLVREPAAKAQALEHLSRVVLPGRWEQVRRPNDTELRQTSVVEVAIEQAVMKSSQADPEELDSPHAWTGRLVLGKRPVLPAPSRSWQQSLGAIEPTQLAARFLR